MHILLTNDDGIASEGLWALAVALRDADYGQITIVAPAEEQSGMSMSFPPRQEHTLAPVEPPDAAYTDITAYTYDGTPVGCVTAAMIGGIRPRPQVIISGINRGLNSGTNVLLSGTVGAAMIGALWGLPAMAVSLQFVGDLPMTWGTAAWAATRVFPLLSYLEVTSGPRLLLNVNVPRVERPADLRGFRQTVLSEFFFGNYLDIGENREHSGERRMRYRFDRARLPLFPESSDEGAIRAGYVSVTALAPMSAYAGLDLRMALDEIS